MTTGGGDQSVTLLLRARDEASQTLRRLGGNVDRLERGFGGFQRTIRNVGFALGGLTLGAASFAAVTGQAERMRKTVAQTEFTMLNFGSQGRRQLERLEPAFGAIAERMNTTETEVERVFTTILRESEGARRISTDHLAGTIALAKVNEISLEQAATLVGQALLQNTEPLRQLTGDMGFPGVNRVLDNAMSAFEDSQTPLDEFKARINRIREDVATLLNQMLRGEGVVGGFIQRFLTNTEEGLEILGGQRQFRMRRDILPDPGEAVASLSDPFGFFGLGEAETRDRIGRFMNENVIDPINDALGVTLLDPFRRQREGNDMLGIQAGPLETRQPPLETRPLPTGRDLLAPFEPPPERALRPSTINLTIMGDVDTEDRARDVARNTERLLNEEQRRGND